MGTPLTGPHFYPSISENVLDQALSWASSLADISHEDISIINHPIESPMTIRYT